MKQDSKIDAGIIPSDLMRSYRDRLEKDLGLIHESKILKQIVLDIKELSSDKKAVTIIGPIGSGRRTIARVLHLSSSDWWRPFIEVDLFGFSDEDSQKYLFGYEEDHFFSATEKRPGMLSLANRSTICFKNFDRYSRSIHRQLYDLHLNRTYSPISSKEVKQFDGRLVFTVQNEIDDLKKTGFIDEDVSHMLCEKTIDLPPLSKRKDDIVPLAQKFVTECCKEFGVSAKALSKETEKWLKKAPWNKNATQLKKSIYFACFNTSDNVLDPNHFALAHDGNFFDYQEKQLDELSIQSLVELKLESFLGRLGNFEASHLYEAIISRVEEPLLRRVMEYAKENQIKASRMLGINRNTLRTKLEKYKIKKSGRAR